ncbi:MAG: Hin recombinase, partial [Proteobacteria bacterium]|nr:Hin recombinase [Pseudomonadota bacterium]
KGNPLIGRLMKSQAFCAKPPETLRKTILEKRNYINKNNALRENHRRPSTLSADQQNEVKEKTQNGETISAIARQFGTSRQTIMGVRDQT